MAAPARTGGAAVPRRPLTARLAVACARRPWWTIVAWAVVTVVAAVVLGLLIGDLKASDDFLGHPESKRAEQLIAQKLPGAGRDTEVVIVQSPTLTVDDPAFRQRVLSLAAQLRALEPVDVAAVTTAYDGNLLAPLLGGASSPSPSPSPSASPARLDSPLVSQDRHTTILPVTMSVAAAHVDEHIERLYDIVHAANGDDGFRVLLTGSGAWEQEAHLLAVSDLTRGEAIGVPMALVILLLVFGSVIAALVPLGLAGVAILVGAALTSALSGTFTVSVFAINVVSIMGLAIGVDYSLFIVSRFREELAGGRGAADAVGRAAATASRAVLFSGMTVVLALCGMLVVPFTVFTSLGTGAILVVLAAMAAALTLLPAVLVLLGARVNRLPIPGRHFRVRSAAEIRHGFWYRAATVIMRRPVIGLVAGTAVLLAIAIPGLGMQRGESGVSALPARLGTRQGYEILHSQFSAGITSPILLVVDGPAGDPRTQIAITNLTGAVEQRGFAIVGRQSSNDGSVTLLQLAINADSTGNKAAEAVRTLRGDVIPGVVDGAPVTVLVGGSPARFADMLDLIDLYQPIVIGVVLALSFVLLLVAFRSVVIALKAVLMNLLSVGAAYGVLTLVFQHGVGASLLGFQRVGRVDAWVPLLMFCFLFGLSMDYEVFLLSRIRERYDQTGATSDAVSFGIGSTAGIITGAALIMVAVFAGLASGELVMFQEIGFGLAVAVALDASIVRVVLVPSVMKLLGRWNWYLPGWLEWLPQVSLGEGEGGGGAPPAQRGDVV